jgi:hypothetical protein
MCGSSMASRELLRQWLLKGALPAPRSEVEAGRIADCAREQGLHALLHSAVVAAGETWPELVCTRLRDEHRAACTRSVRQLTAAGRVVSLLAGNGIRTLPLKGAAVAETLYDSVADRPMDDVDLLVLDDWRRAARTLTAHDYAMGSRADHACEILDAASGTCIELHRSVTSCPGLFPLEAERVWDRRRRVVGQLRILPSVEDLLVHLGLHAAFQHGLVLPLGRYLDFRRLLERSSPDIDRLLEIATASRARAALAAALVVAERVVGAPVSEPLRAALAADLPRRLTRASTWSEPLDFVSPNEPAIIRARWELTRGRHLKLLWLTLSPRPFEPTSPVRRIAVMLARALRLARAALGAVLPSLRSRRSERLER